MGTTCFWRYLGEGVQIFPPNIILKPEQISIGNFSRVDGFTRIEGGEGVSIGEYCHIASFCSLNAGGGELVIGSHSGCSCGVRIATGQPDLSYLELSPCEPPELVHTIRKKTVIGEYVVIFSNAVILPGITIGDGAVVAAGAVVTKDVEPFTIVAGVPARKIGDRDVVVR